MRHRTSCRVTLTTSRCGPGIKQLQHDRCGFAVHYVTPLYIMLCHAALQMCHIAYTTPHNGRMNRCRLYSTVCTMVRQPTGYLTGAPAVCTPQKAELPPHYCGFVTCRSGGRTTTRSPRPSHSAWRVSWRSGPAGRRQQAAPDRRRLRGALELEQLTAMCTGPTRALMLTNHPLVS